MKLDPSAIEAAYLIDRLDRLTRSGASIEGLNPAQWEALRFLAPRESVLPDTGRAGGLPRVDTRHRLADLDRAGAEGVRRSYAKRTRQALD